MDPPPPPKKKKKKKEKKKKKRQKKGKEKKKKKKARKISLRIVFKNVSVFLLSHRVLELIHESKWLSRLSIAIPDSAKEVLQQEARFKRYKDHLELCLKDFSDVCASIPQEMGSLFKMHVDRALQNFHPGLSTLAWNSMNIGQYACKLFFY